MQQSGQQVRTQQPTPGCRRSSHYHPHPTAGLVHAEKRSTEFTQPHGRFMIKPDVVASAFQQHSTEHVNSHPCSQQHGHNDNMPLTNTHQRHRHTAHAHAIACAGSSSSSCSTPTQILVQGNNATAERLPPQTWHMLEAAASDCSPVAHPASEKMTKKE